MSEIMLGGNAQSAMKDLIKVGDTKSFAIDVIEASKQIPVIVDFWAPWCGPCKQLGPAIEQAVMAAQGKVKLVKIDADENQQLAAQLRVQSIPTVFAFIDGRPVDGFTGAMPQSQVVEFINKVIAMAPDDGVEDALAAADSALQNNDHLGAAQIYAQIIQHQNDNLKAIAGLAKCQIAAGEFDLARKTLGLTPPSKEDDPDITSARASLELAQQPGDSSAIAELTATVEANPADNQARLNLALALNKENNREAAVDHLINIIEKEAGWNDEAARKQLLQFFDAWGFADPASVAGRRRLSTLLFS
jgi:putative thioredoxin